MGRKKSTEQKPLPMEEAAPAEEKTAEPEAEAEGAGVNKAEAIREALNELGSDAKAADVMDFVKNKHPHLAAGIDRNPKSFASSISGEKRKLFGGESTPRSKS